jgi:PilZ domain
MTEPLTASIPGAPPPPVSDGDGATGPALTTPPPPDVGGAEPSLTSSPAPDAGLAERRRHARTPINLDVRLVVAGLQSPVPAVLKDLSESGCFFATAAQINLGWNLSISFLLKPRDLCQAEGRVVRVQSQQGFGVQFDKVNDHLLRLVEMLLAAPDEEQSAMLQGLCDPDIEIGYVRRPSSLINRDCDATPEIAPPTECPKCGFRTTSGPQTAEGEGPSGGRAGACRRCGLIFASWTAEQAARRPRLDERGEVLWAEAVASWQTPETHQVFLEHCSLVGLLPVAGRLYRLRLDEDPADAVAEKMQARLLAMATAAFVPAAPGSSAPITRSFWFWALLLVVGAAGLAAASLDTAHWGRRSAAPAAVPAPARHDLPPLAEPRHP